MTNSCYPILIYYLNQLGWKEWNISAFFPNLSFGKQKDIDWCGANTSTGALMLEHVEDAIFFIVTWCNMNI